MLLFFSQIMCLPLGSFEQRFFLIKCIELWPIILWHFKQSQQNLNLKQTFFHNCCQLQNFIYISNIFQQRKIHKKLEITCFATSSAFCAIFVARDGGWPIIVGAIQRARTSGDILFRERFSQT